MYSSKVSPYSTKSILDQNHILFTFFRANCNIFVKTFLFQRWKYQESWGNIFLSNWFCCHSWFLRYRLRWCIGIVSTHNSNFLGQDEAAWELLLVWLKVELFKTEKVPAIGLNYMWAPKVDSYLPPPFWPRDQFVPNFSIFLL